MIRIVIEQIAEDEKLKDSREALLALKDLLFKDEKEVVG